MSAPSHPFRGLARFEDTDADAALFFGRERDREIVAANLVASRLTVLYGASGVGKSSLLRAGVAHNLRRSPEPQIVVVFDAWQADPVEGLKQAVAEAADVEPGRTLADTLDDCATAVGGDVYVLLDQVDEYFLYHGTDSGPGTFAEEFPAAVARSGLRASFLLALREETVAKLDSFKSRIPNVLGNYLRLEHLDRAAGRAAILGPIEEVNHHATPDEQLEIEPELVEEVLDEVAAGKLDLGESGKGAVKGAGENGRIETPYLQLVMQRLWAAERESGSRTLRLQTLRELGGAEQIVRDRLRGALDALSPEQQDVTAALFNHLVTPSGTKIAHGPADLAEYAHIDEATLVPVLSRLADERILRPVGDGSGGERYEIYHDVLAEAALSWKRDHDVDRELERQQEQTSRRHRRLLVALAAAVFLIAVMAAVTVFALSQRSNARSEARVAHARELVALSLSQLSADPIRSLRSAVQAAKLAPEAGAENAVRQALLAAHELAVVPTGGPGGVARYSFDGRRVLTAGPNGLARIHDLRTRRLLATMDHGAPVRDALIVPGDRLVLTAGDDGTVKLWMASDGRLVRTLRDTVPLRALAVDPQGRLAASVGGHQATLWRISDGKSIATLRAPRPLTHADFSPDGRLVVVAGLDRKARVYRTADGSLVHLLDQRGSITSASFSPGGRLLVTTGKDGTAKIWDVRSGRGVREFRSGLGNVFDASFSPRGTKLATVGSDGGHIWLVSSGSIVSTLVGHINQVTSVAFSPDGFFVVTASKDKTARVWKADNGDERAVLAGHGETVRQATFSPDGKTVLTVGDDGTARLWNPEEQPRMPVLTRERGAVTQIVDAGPGLMLVAGRGGARLVRLSDGRTAHRFASGRFPSVSASPTGSRIAVGSGRRVTVYEGRNESVLTTLEQPAAVKSVALSPDGTRIAVAGADGIGRVWTVDGKLLHELRGHRAALTDIAYSRDGALLATGSSDDTARVWNARSGVLEHVLHGRRADVTSVDFSPDGRYVLTASEDGDARRWDTATGALVQLLRWHNGTVSDASFSPDGRWIVTAGPATAQLWQPGVENPLLPFGLAGHVRPLTSAVFDSSSRAVVTGSLDGTVRSYRCRLCGGLDELLRLAQTRLSGAQ
jgi:WD40 repeat protein